MGLVNNISITYCNKVQKSIWSNQECWLPISDVKVHLVLNVVNANEKIYYSWTIRPLHQGLGGELFSQKSSHRVSKHRPVVPDTPLAFQNQFVYYLLLQDKSVKIMIRPAIHAFFDDTHSWDWFLNTHCSCCSALGFGAGSFRVSLMIGKDVVKSIPDWPYNYHKLPECFHKSLVPCGSITSGLQTSQQWRGEGFSLTTYKVQGKVMFSLVSPIQFMVGWAVYWQATPDPSCNPLIPLVC